MKIHGKCAVVTGASSEINTADGHSEALSGPPIPLLRCTSEGYCSIKRHQNAKSGPASEAMACLIRGSLCSVSPGAKAIQSELPC